MEEGANDRNDNKNEKYDEEREADETTDVYSTTIDESKGVVDKRGGKDFDLDEFDASTCSGDSFCDIFENKNGIITDDYNVWVYTNKKMW